MIKYIFIIFNVLGIILIDNFIGQRVTVSVNAPMEVQAGEEFRVQVTINKGELSSFARFQQKLPAGLKAIEVNSASAVDFSFEENRVRIIWLRLPEDEEFTFSYRVRVDERLKGSFNLEGTFSYIENNERKSEDLDPTFLAINPSPNISPELLVDISEFEEKVIPDLTNTEAPGIICIRQKPDISNSSAIQVNLLVNKNDFKQFAKIEEQIPEGYTAISNETQDAIFSFKDQVAKFIWRNLPSNPHFLVSYTLVPSEGAVLEDLANISGQFSYFENEKTQIINISERTVDFNSMTEDEVLAFIQQETGGKLFADNSNSVSIPDVINEEKTATTTQTNTTQQNNSTGNRTQTEIKTNNQTQTVNKPKETKTNVIAGDRNFVLQPEEGIYYRVQLAAGHKPVDIKSYFKKSKIDKEIKREFHEGWHKYSVGSFDVYKDARDYRVHIWNTTEINDAFVSAYNNGLRITVQEALMIANQKWYK